MAEEEEGPRETEPVLVPEPKPTRSVAATVTDVPWLADVEQMRKRVLAEAESLRGEARGHYENLSNQAREKLVRPSGKHRRSRGYSPRARRRSVF